MWRLCPGPACAGQSSGPEPSLKPPPRSLPPPCTCHYCTGPEPGQGHRQGQAERGERQAHLLSAPSGAGFLAPPRPARPEGADALRPIDTARAGGRAGGRGVLLFVAVALVSLSLLALAAMLQF